ncbi:hypothetical protein LV89_02955 [Arcicella aurantiaca]|uniref:Uncharacterized protein n=1 Tax=Arcicella aurantiaca TaxID=591202 RepID=A0A316E4G3_9BACT|nr:hypothetical protein [Arcicella aurantiaca]PWK24442.1 hypothetical protein LV89_02955 [Arcicella aurantiaca]
MKSDNKSLANEISSVVLGKLHGLNAKSAKKLVKAVDEASKDIVKKFAKLQKDEADVQEKDAKKALKKAAEKAKKVAKAKEKATEKAALDAKIAIVTNDRAEETPKVVAPKATSAKKTAETAKVATAEETKA